MTDLDIEISVLTPMKQISDINENARIDIAHIILALDKNNTDCITQINNTARIMPSTAKCMNSKDSP